MGIGIVLLLPIAAASRPHREHLRNANAGARSPFRPAPVTHLRLWIRSATCGPISLFVGTWNVNGKVCSDGDLKEWFFAAGLPAATGEAPSACIIGFQEFVALDAKNLLRDDETRKRDCRSRLSRVLEVCIRWQLFVERRSFFRLPFV